MYNPDYPTTSGAGFVQHTYKPFEQQNESFYYNGGNAINPFNSITPPVDSRRNFGNPNTGYPQQFGYGMPNMTAQVPTNNQAIPEANVMPFGTYPPAPNAVPGMPAFNSLVESRRNATAVANNGTNPWATNTPQVQTPVVPPVQTTPMNSNPYYGNNVYGNFGNPIGCPIEMNTAALYGNNQFGFDRKAGCWENPYTAGRTIPTPAVDWKTTVTNNDPYQQQTYYPAAQYPQTKMNWSEIAKCNWGTGNI